MLVRFHVHVLPGNTRNRHPFAITKCGNGIFNRALAAIIVNIEMFYPDFPVIIQPFGQVIIFVFYNAANGQIILRFNRFTGAGAAKPGKQILNGKHDG